MDSTGVMGCSPSALGSISADASSSNISSRASPPSPACVPALGFVLDVCMSAGGASGLSGSEKVSLAVSIAPSPPSPPGLVVGLVAGLAPRRAGSPESWCTVIDGAPPCDTNSLLIWSTRSCFCARSGGVRGQSCGVDSGGRAQGVRARTSRGASAGDVLGDDLPMVFTGFVAAADQAESAEPLAGALGRGAVEVTGGAKTAGSAAVGAAAAAIVFSLCPQQK